MAGCEGEHGQKAPPGVGKGGRERLEQGWAEGPTVLPEL